MDTGRPQNNIFSDNIMTGGSEGIKLTVADGTEFIDNTFVDTDTIRFEDCTGTVMSGNTGLDGVELKVYDDSCFAAASDDAYTPNC